MIFFDFLQLAKAEADSRASLSAGVAHLLSAFEFSPALQVLLISIEMAAHLMENST